MKIKFNLVRIIIIFTLFLCYSCSSEEDTIPETERVIETTVLTPKTLATISLPSGTTIIFKTETDGIVFEASGDSDNYGELENLRDLSVLHRFLILTNENVAVPTDLIKLEEDQKIKEKALQRGTIEKHSVNLPVVKSFLNRVTKSFFQFCDHPTRRFNTSDDDEYKDSFINYTGISWTSSAENTKSEGNKCRKVEFHITNCADDGGIGMFFNHYYRLSNGNLKLYKTTYIPQHTHKYYSKTFTTKSIHVTKITSLQNRRFVGVIIFSKYKDGSVGELAL
ncbi:hypothetical protein [Aquimarina spinulae]|uniref:hypothetical protein n=1 Tax=Aquimarina spinulae TaxID=1192023 RepID=UPI000D550B62|nr:hypothetical protein [Aquimarina spinulae]